MITPLRCGVDTLEATFAGILEPEFVEELDRRKKLAQQQNQANTILLNESEFHLLPKGASLWPFVVRNDQLLIRFGTAANIPAMSVRMLAEGLAGRGIAALWCEVRRIADDLGLIFQNCSRIDIALDFQGEWFTHGDMLNVVCPASFRPVYPNTTNPETFQFGKGDIVVRVYNKSVEIVANKHQWWVFVWRLCDGYIEGEPVYRVEVQLRSKVLKELGFFSVERLIEELPELFAYGLGWCSLRMPTEDTNHRRRPEDSRWTALRTAFSPSRALGRVRPVTTIIGYDACVKRFVSLLTSVGATVDSVDFWHLCKAITTDAEQLIEHEMETTFEALVEKKQMRRYL